MMRGALPVARGLVLCPHGSDVSGLPSSVGILFGGHPEPTPEGIASSRRIAAAVSGLRRDETLLFLLSGGASALLEIPRPGLDDDDLIAAHRALVASGADITEINRVRCCLSAVKGGALAALAAPARVCTFAVSDVVGDDPATIGSGPTFAAACGARQSDAIAALAIVARYAIQMPSRVLVHLESMASAGGSRREDHADSTCEYEVIAAVRDAVEAAAAFVEAQGWQVSVRPQPISGTTTVAAAEMAQQLAWRGSGNAPRAWIAGGETTVRVPAACDGRGGRNLDLAARVAVQIAGRERVACVVAGTDGRDGSSRAAGAIIDGGTAGRAAAAGFALPEALAAFDTEPAIEAAGDLLVTGPTGTNVGDLLVAVSS